MDIEILISRAIFVHLQKQKEIKKKGLIKFAHYKDSSNPFPSFFSPNITSFVHNIPLYRKKMLHPDCT